MMSFKALQALRSAKVAGPQNEMKTKNLDIPTATSPSPSTSSTTQDELHMRICKVFPFIEATYQDLQRFISGLHKSSISSQLMHTINKYKSGCKEIYEKALESYDLSYKLAQNIVRTMDIFKELCTCLSDLEEYNYRMCEIMSIFIVCELRLSVDAAQNEQILIAQRIIYIIRRHLIREEESETLINILRTLVYVPKLFNARNIMCAIFSEFIPLKPVAEVNVLPDKLYMLYIIVFYRWMMMQKEENDKLLVVNFAENFMKPSVSLCSNNLYGAYLPMYTTHSTATRTILNNLTYYRDIRNASIIDNALKPIGAVVNLCDDEDDDVVVVCSSLTADFAQLFAAVRLEPLSGGMSNIKLEEKTVVDTVDLTEEEEPMNPVTSLSERHDKWLNEFRKLAQQYRESQLLLQKQQTNQLISSGEKDAIISLDSDSEEETEISAAGSKETPTTATATATQQCNSEDLFVDNYPLTNTPLHCDSELESLEPDEDTNDVTKISPRFLSGILRTYQAKKSNVHETNDKINSCADESNKSLNMDKYLRRDSLHISSTPPEENQNEEDDSTDVQDEHEDEEEEVQAYAFLPTAIKSTEKPIYYKQIRPMGPYPTYNNMHNDKVVFSQTTSRYPQQQQLYKDKQYYYSDSSAAKSPKKQKKRVQFNTKPLGPTGSTASQTSPHKLPALHQIKYKVSDAPEYSHLRGFERFSCGRNNEDAASTLGSTSTTSSIKQQDHLEAAALFFRHPNPGQFSPSLSSVSSRSLTSPGTPSKGRKKSLAQTNKKPVGILRRPTMGNRDDFSNSANNEERYSIIRNRDTLNDEYHSAGGLGVSSFGESSDDYYGVASDSDMIIKARYKNDPKLRKRCAVVLTPNEQVLQYERKRDEMYNAILQKQRRKLELRALEKQREKERRRLGRSQEKKPTKLDNRGTATTPRTRSYNEFCMSSESECETKTKFELRTRRPRQQHFKELEPLNIHIEMSAVTTTLLSQIDSHLDKPTSENIHKLRGKEQTKNNGINKQTCDANIDKSPTKMRELNLLADIAQHLSPYQLDLPENNSIPRTPSPAPEPESLPITKPTPTPTPPPELPATQMPNDKEVPKEKITITEQLIIQSSDSLLENRKPQLDNNNPEQQASTSYAHEPKLNTAAKFKSSPSANSVQTQNQQRNTQLESNDNNLRNSSVEKEIESKNKTDETLEQILEESISVLKSVTSPYNPPNDDTSLQQQIRNNSTTPILISNVESINEFEETDVVDKQKSGDKENLKLQDTHNKNSEQFALAENEIFSKETSEKSKEFLEENRARHESTDVLSANILNCSDSAIMCAADVSNMPNEFEISQNLKVSPLMAVHLSDISLESELSKHLPEIAEPSPVVTDMSDNSNDSDVSKGFGLHMPINSNTTNLAHSINEIPVPELPLVMPHISQTSTPSTSQALESSFTQFNCTLNTPTKLAVDMSRLEDVASNSTSELNTPLKFTVQSNLESTNIPLKSSIEAETDNNVTKFLDLILNKTVTDAESETRDKIIKELNALTADTTEVSETNENICNNEVTPESKLNEEATNNSIPAAAKTLQNETLIEDNATDINQDVNKSHQTLEYSSTRHNSSTIEIDESKCSLNGQNDSQTTTSSNNELNPPKENHKEAHTQLINNISNLPSNPSSPLTEIKSLATKQTFNIRCRVRLKRLNVDEHCRINKNESCTAVPIIKPIELVSSNNDITKCDNVTTKTLSAKKTCLKHNNKHTNKEMQDKNSEQFVDAVTVAEDMPSKKPKLEIENPTQINTTQTSPSQQLSTEAARTQHSQTAPPVPATPSTPPAPLVCNNTSSAKFKAKPLKTVTFDLSNLNEELRDSVTSNHKQKSKSHAAGMATGVLGCYLKSSRPSRKLPDNTLRAAETLQLFVNTINESVRTPPATEFNKKRTPIKNKCIAEDETPRPPPASTLMGTPPCKKTCIEKTRSQITTTKCKDQLVSSLGTPSISSITSDITTARIYTSSPLDQTLPEYDDNVDTVADSELILPTTSGSLRRKLKRPKKSLSRPEPPDDVSTDDISNHPECNGEDDTDAVVDNEDDVFAEELLPIPAANEHILEEIVSARPSHIGTSTVIRDDYMNIEATATVPVYLFNDESRDLGSPELIQSSDTTSVVDSSSYLKGSISTAATNNVVAAVPPSTPSVMGNLEKSMLSPSEHEVSSTQETFYQTPTKNKQTELFGEKSGTSKEKGNSSAGSIIMQKPEDNSFKSKEEYQTSSNIGLLQNNQVDTTNHSPEMCSLTLTATAPMTTNLSSNRKIRKASTHDEILFNELQQQQQQQQLPANKRKSHTTFCVESTSDNKNNAIGKNKIAPNNMDDIKSNGSLAKVDDKFKKLLKEVCKKDKTQTSNELGVGLACASNIGGGGSSPSTTTTINEDKLPKSKRKKLKSSKSNKSKSHSERSSKIVLKASKLTPHMPANPLIITIPKSRLLKPPSSPQTPIESKDVQQQSEFLDILHSKLFIEKDTKDAIPTATAATAPPAAAENINQDNHAVQYHSMSKNELINEPSAVLSKSKNSQSFANISNELVKPLEMLESDLKVKDTRNTNSTNEPKEKSSFGVLTTKRKDKKTANSTSSSKDNNLIFAKDKYDLIKSKDKHHHHSNHLDQQDNKEKSKDKTSSQSKSGTSSNARSHKSSSKEKIKGEKSKEKHNKDIQKIIVNHQADNNTKSYTLEANNKFSSSGLSTAMTSSTSSSASFTTNNAKPSNSKSSKNNSSSSSSPSSLSYPAILKSKTNLTTTPSGAAAATATAPASLVSSQITTATPSTNNVRKKMKIK